MTSVAVATPVATPVAIATPYAPRQNDQPFSSSTGEGKWRMPLCGLCSCKASKVCEGPNGCIQECCCKICVYSSAIAKSGVDPFKMSKDEDMRCIIFGFGMCCEVVPCQTLIVRATARLAVAKK